MKYIQFGNSNVLALYHQYLIAIFLPAPVDILSGTYLFANHKKLVLKSSKLFEIKTKFIYVP